MTPEQHNKYLGRAHITYGVFTGLFMFVMIGFLFALLRADPNGPPWPFTVFMSLFIGFIYSMMMIPSFIAGYGLLKRKRWAKTAAIAGGVVSAMSFPIGTAICVYTFWFLFSEPGRILYDNSQRMLPQQRDAAWSFGKKEIKEEQYVPPASPPDWR